MSNVDLALKWRPKCFAEVVGQESVISILSRQIATKTWKNTYLFAGAYGCGKTTCARIFANEINDGEGQPIEIDGASHNGVDDIRALIADAQQSSIECKYKVYLIDEAHMITTQGWNAALKLIEEPPTDAIFIFCTTNPEKLPQTILSRLQRFDFKRVNPKVIADRLEYILNEEQTGCTYVRSALDRIAVLADGHVRDAIKLMDKCLSNTNDLSLENVETLLGLFKYESLVTITNGIVSKNLDQCLSELEHVRSTNSDMLKFMDALLSFAIDCAIYAELGSNEHTNIPDDMKATLNVNKDTCSLLVERLVGYRRHADVSNAEVLIKAIFVEMCEN